MKKSAVLALSLTLSPFAPASAQDPGTATLPDSLMAAGTRVEWVKKLPAYCEGPAVDHAGVVWFTEQQSNSTPAWPIWKIDPAAAGDTGTVFLRNSDQANGLSFDMQGRLVATQNRKITRFEKNGGATLLAESGKGAVFGQANDISLGSNGSFYFTDLGSNVFHVDSSGALKTAYSGASSANGIFFFEESRAVYVNQGGQVTRFQIGAGGTLSNPTRYCSVNGPDGGAVDSHGNFWIASYSDGAIYVFGAGGNQVGKIVMKASGIYDTRPGNQGNTSNAAFGGPDGKTLYITGDGGLYSLKVKVAGRRLGGPTALNPRKAVLIKAVSGNDAVSRLGWDGLGRIQPARADKARSAGGGAAKEGVIEVRDDQGGPVLFRRIP